MNSTEWQEIKSIFLTAFEMPEQERADFLVGCEEHVRTKVENLLKADKNAESFIVEPAIIDTGLVEENSQDPFIGGSIDGYKIIREIGQGGMGTVYLANREGESFDKTVALKLVKRGMDTNAVLKRFVMERSILAHLEHPNIAGLIDGGTTPDGLPYFVMEYVDGQPVTKYCDANASSINERLELFQKVCAAVSYAHANLVVHRDIKPSNILVTQDGTPKLLDFGIAKLLHPDWSLDTAEATATMFRILTPEYASPEQIRGLAVTTASDVYSLGVVLYELLSGERPYKIESRLPDEAANEILTAEPVRPSSVMSAKLSNSETPAHFDTARSAQRTTNDERQTNPKFQIPNLKSLRGDLDNIVLKAIRKEPERRYASVQEFSEDIRRHLAGLPVTATADTKIYRLTKFAKRHSAGVAAGCLIALTLITATAITGWQAIAARRERDKAEQRFNQVRKLANTVLFDYHNRIANLPGSTPLREKMVKDALEYLDNLAAEAGQDSTLQLELAMAYQKIGDIQGGLDKSHLGRRQDASESYGKALAIMESLVTTEPGNFDFRRKLAASYMKRGDILFVEADIVGAAESYGKALDINSELVKEAMDDEGLQLEAANSRINFGYMVAAQGRGDEGLENLQRAVSQLEELAIASPNDIEIQSALADGYDKAGEIWIGLTENYLEALRNYQKSQKISDALFAGNPLDTRLRRGVAVSYLHVAQAYAKLRDNKLALDNSRKSLAIFSDMLSADSQNDDFRQIVATVQGFVCELLIETGKPDEAIPLLNQSRVTLENSFAASPTDEFAHFRLADVQAALGKAHAAMASKNNTPPRKRLGDWREARLWFEKSLEIYKPFRAAGITTGDQDAKIDLVAADINKCVAEIARLTQ